MEESLRRQYLEAMGIQNWVGRDAAPDPDAAQTMPKVQAMAPHTKPGTEAKPSSTVARGDIATLDWDGLRDRVKACKACELHQTRTQTVFGVGNQDADLMIRASRLWVRLGNC